MRLIFALLLLTSIALNEGVVYASLWMKVDNIAMDIQKETNSEKEQKETIDEEVKIPLRVLYLQIKSEEECTGVISPSYITRVIAQPIIDIHSPPPDLV